MLDRRSDQVWASSHATNTLVPWLSFFAFLRKNNKQQKIWQCKLTRKSYTILLARIL